MKATNLITITEYLTRKGIPFKETKDELLAKCIFNDCDADSRENEAHLYFSRETGQYDCKKCSAQGNLSTLAKHLGDDLKDMELKTSKQLKAKDKNTKIPFDIEIIEKCHSEIPERIRVYLNSRGITDEIIKKYKIGFGQFYARNWITIPVKNSEGEFTFFKLRKDPRDERNKNKYMVYPQGSEAAIYGIDMLKNNIDYIVICEGELDKLVLESDNIVSITFTAGAGTFNKDWIEQIKKIKKIYIAFDNDKAGKEAAKKITEILGKELPESQIYNIELPQEMKGKDITDYFTKNNGNVDLFFKLSKQVAGRMPIDVSKLKPMSSKELIEILGLTIKKDEENKVTTFLCLLSAYTEDSQFNLSFNAPSSTGKSYIPIEVSNLFPKEDLLKLGNCSPTAFFHEQGHHDKETNTITVDLSRKIIIFLDQPSNALLTRLRSLLSHDEKEMQSKITDKSGRGGNKTKTVILIGFPAVVFCSAGLKIDEQEGTRFLLLSPNTSQEKLREGILERIKKDTDKESYIKYIEENQKRRLLMERIRGVKEANISHIKIENSECVKTEFFTGKSLLKPKHQRDIGRFMNLIKMFALLNLWFRKREGNTIFATKEDIEEALRIWEIIAESQEYSLPPYICNLYKEVILPAFREKNKKGQTELLTGEVGLERKGILKRHYEVYGKMIPDWQLRQEILPMLETAGLIYQESEGRQVLVYCTPPLTMLNEKENSE